MDKKASCSRKKEKCGVAKNSDKNVRKTNRKEMEKAEAPNNSQVGVCGEGKNMTDVSKACVNVSPHLDIEKGSEFNGSALVPSSETPDGPKQCKTMSQSGRSSSHRDEVTNRNTETGSIIPTEDDACLEELSPEQQRILLEKTELEHLLEQTKRLQQQAELCLHRKDENSASKQSELSSRERSTGGKESNQRTTEAVPHEQNVSLSTQAEPHGWLKNDDAESSVLSENASFSFRDNIQLLEENAELFQKKIELEVLLQTAQVLLQKTDLPGLNHNDEEDFSFADDTCDVPSENLDNSGKLEAGAAYVEDNYKQSENRSSVEILYDKADEITRKAKLFVDLLHEDADLGTKKTQWDLENPNPLLENSDLASDKTNELHTKSLVHMENREEEAKALQGEKKGLLNKSPDCAEGYGEVKEQDEVDDNDEMLDQKLELQRLLDQARWLLEKSKKPLWTDSKTKEMETKELSRTIEKKVFEEEMVDQKENTESKPPEVKTSDNKIPFDAKKEASLEEIETERHVEDSDARKLQLEEVANSALCHTDLGLSETVAANTNSWPEVQTALLCEKNELSLLLMKTELLQQKAEMILTRNQLQIGTNDLMKIVSTPLLANDTQLSSQETTEMLNTAKLSSEITKPDSETAGTLSKKLKQTVDAPEQSSVNVTTIAEQMKTHPDETQLSTQTKKERPDATPLPSEATEELDTTTLLSPETTKEEIYATLQSPETTKPTLETTEVPLENIKYMSEVTQGFSDATNTKQKSSLQKIPAPDDISSETSQTIASENLKPSAESSSEMENEIPQEKKPTEENLQISECTKKQKSNDPNHSDMSNEAVLTEDDPKIKESLSNTGASNEETQSDEDSESSDEDDPSFDSTQELRLLLQRAKLLIEKSKVPVSQRQCPPHSEMNHPPESVRSWEQEKESNNPEPCTSHTAAGRLAELATEENEGSHPKKQITNCEITNKTEVSLQQSNNVQDEIKPSPDAQLEFLLAKTKLLKLQADELITQISISEPTTDQQLPKSELSNENKVQPTLQTDDLHSQLNVSETESDQQTLNTHFPTEETKVVSGLESCTTLSSDQRREESKGGERIKRPTELNLDRINTEQHIDSSIRVPENEIKESVPPLSEDTQLELEEIEESQLEISENENSQLEIEEEYLSDDSELSEMNMYYDDGDYSHDEDEKLPEENKTIDNEEQFLEKHQQTESAGKKEKTYDEKRELELLLEITQLLLEKATLPLELIETIPDDNNSSTPTESASETVKADTAAEELNLSLQDSVPVLETTQTFSQENETVTESIAMSMEKTGTVIETTETGTVAETTETETVIENMDMLLQKTETVTGRTDMTLDRFKPILNELASEKSHSSIKKTKVGFLMEEGSDSKHLNGAPEPERSPMSHKSHEQLLENMTSSELSQKLEQLKTEVTSFLESEQRVTAENSSMAGNSLQDKAGEANAENNKMLATDGPEEAHSDQSDSMVITNDVGNEQGSQFQDEATASNMRNAEEASDLDSKPFKGWTPMSSYTLLLKLQGEMAKMQLQLSNLQDAMRTTNCVIQQLMDEAFSEM